MNHLSEEKVPRDHVFVEGLFANKVFGLMVAVDHVFVKAMVREGNGS